MLHFFWLGLSHFFKAGRFIRKRNLLFFYILPLVFNVIAFYFLFDWLAVQINLLVSLLEQKLNISQLKISKTGHQSINILSKILSFLTKIIVFYFSYTIVKYIILALLSPWFGYISEKTAEIISDKAYPFRLMKIFSDAKRGILLSMRNLIAEIFFTLFFLITSLLFPPFAPFAIILNVYISSYYFGFAMYDYVYERQSLSILESLNQANKDKGALLGLGFCMFLCQLIPVIGITIANANGAVAASLHKGQNT